MPLPHHDTLISYPDGATISTGTVLHVAALGDGRSAVLLDRTAFHPVDTAWPDQPSDRGTLRAGDVAQPIVEGLTAGIHEGVLHVGADLPVRSGTEGWIFAVAHVIEGPAPAVGETVTVDVDAEHRRALSAGHTGCHLASLALDAALQDAWSKPAPLDALGRPGFDQLAIQSSRIVPDGSVDVYRVGKSLRRKGFDPASLSDTAALADAVDRTLAGWIGSQGAVRIERSDEALSARRRWVCELPEGSVSIPCGGTHLSSLGAIAAMCVEFATRAVEGGVELEMRTRVTPAP